MGWRYAVICAVLVCGCLCAVPPPPGSHRIVAVGDLHGDYENMIAILQHAQLIDKYNAWIGGRDVLVQMGDCVDRGPHGHTILEFLYDLKASAQRHGGDVVQLIGNHEVMNLHGDFKFVTKEMSDAFGGVEGYNKSFHSSGVYGAYLASLPHAVVLNGTLFVHGGLLPEFAKRGLDYVNSEAQKAILRGDFLHPLLMNDGPVWTRKVIQQASMAHVKGGCDLLVHALSELSAHEVVQGRPPVVRMVVGHTIQDGGTLKDLCNGKMVAIDICISQYMPGCGHLGHLVILPKPGGVTVHLAKYPDVRKSNHKLTGALMPRPHILRQVKNEHHNLGAAHNDVDHKDLGARAGDSHAILHEDLGAHADAHIAKIQQQQSADELTLLPVSHAEKAGPVTKDIWILLGVAFCVVVWRMQSMAQHRLTGMSKKKEDDGV